MSNNSPFWNAYTSAVKNQLLPGVTPPKDNEIFVLPFTVPFTNATTPRTAEEVNYLLYNLANTTLAADGSKGNYAQELNTYLNTVDTSTLLDPAAEKELQQADKGLKAAQTSLDQTEKQAKQMYDTVPPPKPPFAQWVLQNYPPYTAAQRTLASAKTKYAQAYQKYWGRYKTLEGYQGNLKKALDTTTHNLPYNMAVQSDGGNATFAPNYSSVGLRDQMNSWIQGSGQVQTLFEVRIDSASPPGTKDESGIYLKLTTKGIYKSDINVGQWNVDNVKALYPKRKEGAPDVLNPKYARPLSFLLAYAPKLEVVIKGDNNQNTNLDNSATTTGSDDKPYMAVLGILGQHFPSK